MVSLSRLARVVYMVGLSLALFLLLSPARSQGPFRANLPLSPPFGGGGGIGFSGGIGGGLGGGALGIAGIGGGQGGGALGVAGMGGGQGGGAMGVAGVGGIGGAGMLGTGPRVIGLPGPPFTFMLNNWLTDSTGSPLALIGMQGCMGFGGISGGIIGIPPQTGMGGGFLGGGATGFSGGIAGIGGFGGGLAGGALGIGGIGGIGGMGMVGMGGMMGFAGKGMGGFNGKKAL